MEIFNNIFLKMDDHWTAGWDIKDQFARQDTIIYGRTGIFLTIPPVVSFLSFLFIVNVYTTSTTRKTSEHGVTTKVMHMSTRPEFIEYIDASALQAQLYQGDEEGMYHSGSYHLKS